MDFPSIWYLLIISGQCTINCVLFDMGFSSIGMEWVKVYSHWALPVQTKNALEYAYRMHEFFSPCMYNELLQCDVLMSTFLQKHAHLMQYINI